MNALDIDLVKEKKSSSTILVCLLVIQMVIGKKMKWNNRRRKKEKNSITTKRKDKWRDDRWTLSRAHFIFRHQNSFTYTHTSKKRRQKYRETEGQRQDKKKNNNDILCFWVSFSKELRNFFSFFHNITQQMHFGIFSFETYDLGYFWSIVS